MIENERLRTVQADISILGCRLQFLRHDNSYTMETVANCIGAGKSQIAKYEKGEMYPSIVTLANLATFYGVSMDYLVGRTNEPLMAIVKNARASGNSKLGA